MICPKCKKSVMVEVHSTDSTHYGCLTEWYSPESGVRVQAIACSPCQKVWYWYEVPGVSNPLGTGGPGSWVDIEPMDSPR